MSLDWRQLRLTIITFLLLSGLLILSLIDCGENGERLNWWDIWVKGLIGKGHGRTMGRLIQG
jgi:hypothetical protein